MSHQHVRIYGSCFGHQLVAQTLLSSHGVHAEKSPMGWEIGVQRVTLSPQFKEKFSLLKNTESMSCQFLHSDHVAGITSSAKLPPDWMTVGKSELCEIQGLFQPGRVLTSQGHPEFDKFIIKTTISNLKENGQFDHKEACDYLNSANQEEDVILFGQILISFMISP
ncbi:hypothetical protein PFICI_15105 [Pestalotiopsis fici W106-1]|uniref:Glutamine amidotransferase domain-containing protein n=1 Tax=Pestalotiopsis fici (strain W106-1 / CGMCC3.15140) TaxID=1229662 RepID=W3WGW2_PESFW|nr:uncharacterized protein PFICI_15105 [Pestalotiopsis fici W106-1]ETS73160.1 hypothetical protein PFICI_15105 [Pestalotiopsis fici W106-1]